MGLLNRGEWNGMTPVVDSTQDVYTRWREKLKSEWWNNNVKTGTERKKVTQQDVMEVRERSCIKICKKGKRNIKSCIYISKKKTNAQFGMEWVR